MKSDLRCELSEERLTSLVVGYRGAFDGQFSEDVSPTVVEQALVIGLFQDIRDGRITVLANDADAALFYRALDWDSRHFDRKMERLEHVIAPAAEDVRTLITAYLHDAIDRDIEHISARVQDSAPDLRSDLQAVGFEEVGAKVMLRRAAVGADARPSGDVTIAPMVASDIAVLAELAGAAIDINRFTEDSAIDPGRIPAVYQGWLKNLAQAEPQNIQVARAEGSIIGFAAGAVGISLYGDLDLAGLLPGFIGLYAVDSLYRGRGVGRALLAETISSLSRKNCSIIFANTDRRNTGSIRAFEYAGFEAFSGFSEWRWTRP